MSIRYATMAMTGLNDPSKPLKCADKDAQLWDVFADAKAALITRADILHKYLDSSNCNHQVRSESGDHHYEVSIEYGPLSLDRSLPFRTVFHVYQCTGHGWIQKVQQ